MAVYQSISRRTWVSCCVVTGFLVVINIMKCYCCHLAALSHIDTKSWVFISYENFTVNWSICAAVSYQMQRQMSCLRIIWLIWCLVLAITTFSNIQLEYWHLRVWQPSCQGAGRSKTRMENPKRTSWWCTTSVYGEVVHCWEVSFGLAGQGFLKFCLFCYPRFLFSLFFLYWK